MMVPRRPRRPHLGRHRPPPGVAANSVKIAVIVAKTTPVGATSLLQTARSAREASMTVPLRHRAMVMRQCRHHPARPHLPLEVAANSVQIVAIAATTTLVGATSQLQIAKCAPEASMPVPLRHRAGDAPAIVLLVLPQPHRL